MGSTRFLCGDDGVSRSNEEVCPEACDPVEGCVACIPGQRRCDGTVSMVCAPDQSGFVTGRDCAENGVTCGPSGFCNDDCALAESTRSNIGCEYWPVPLPLFDISFDPRRFDYRVAVANPNATSANVRVFRGTSMVASASVPAGGLEVIALPWVQWFDPSVAFGRGWTSVSVTDGAYRLVSDRPVTVSQFAPFEYASGGRFSYSNDASLLLPAHSLTGSYFASTKPSLGPGPGYVAIVGVTPETTQISVELTAAIRADGGGRFPASGPGDVVSFTIARGEVVVLFSAVAGGRTEDHDLSGSRIRANHAVAVFGGHICTNIPFDASACDHLESQLPPLETWGRNFNSAPMYDPSGDPLNFVRVAAGLEETSVTITPPQDGVSTFTLAAGQWREIAATSAFQVTASRGVMVTQFLVSQSASRPTADRGDPSMVILAPREQYRRDYTFVAPTSYNPGTNGQNYLLVVRNPGQSITLNGATINPTWTMGGDREIGVLPITGGIHSMQSTETFGAVVFGMGTYTSYAFPAGLDLEDLQLI